MDILLLYENENNEMYLNELFILLSELGINNTILCVDDSSLERIAQNIAEKTQLIIVYDGDSLLNRRWFNFIMGYGRGKPGTVAVYMPVSEILPAPYAEVPVYLSVSEVDSYIRGKYKQWQRDQRLKFSKEALKRMGIGFSESALFECVIEGESKAVELFLRAGYSADLKTKNGIPLLALSVRHKHRTIVQLLLGSGVEVNTVSGDRGNTALMDAASDGSVDILTDLIDAGADLEQQSKNGQTALILSTGNGRKEVAEVLIRAGADVTKTDLLGMNARKYSQLFHLDSVVQLIDQTESD